MSRDWRVFVENIIDATIKLGVGINTDIIIASVKAVLSSLNRHSYVHFVISMFIPSFPRMRESRNSNVAPMFNILNKHCFLSQNV